MRVLTGEHAVALANGASINVVIRQKGLGWNGVATYSAGGNTLNIVERDYLCARTTHEDLMTDMCELVTQHTGF